MAKTTDTQQLIDGLNEILRNFSSKQIPSVEEIKRQNVARNARALSANERMVANAIGKEIRVATGGNAFLTGRIVEAELTQFGQAKIVMECGVDKVRRGPFFVSKLPR